MSSKTLTGILLVAALASCKKDKKTSISTETETAANSISAEGATRAQLTMDSLFLYAKEVYLWNDVLPAYNIFNPRNYTTYGNGLAAFEKELFNITQYKINSSTGKPYEYHSTDPTYPKYSYIEENETSGTTAFRPSALQTVSLEGVGYDFGLALSSVTATDIRIRYVNPNSPADKAGLTRGDRIVSINNRTSRADSQTEVNFINNALESSSITLKIEKTSGSIATHQLNKISYTSSPVMKTSVIENGGKKIGYIVFARFSNLSNSQTALDNAFKTFASAGITDLVVDLRYNGGGYVTTAEYLANLIAPASTNGKVMYTEHYNTTMQADKATILKNQPIYDNSNKLISYSSGVNGKFATYADVDYSVSGNTYKFSKKGSLENLGTVCFIVSGSTASASELTLNALKPYMKVKLVGSTTYGKPVGFFGINIDGYTVYMSNFQSKNANGEGDYFSGISVDISATDDVTRDLGDTQEVCLSKAIAYITSGTTLTANTKMTLKNGATVSSSEVTTRTLDDQSDFKGMVETRYKFKN